MLRKRCRAMGGGRVADPPLRLLRIAPRRVIDLEDESVEDARKICLVGRAGFDLEGRLIERGLVDQKQI